jgi:2-phospho-L-lactate guanylyltransferase
LKLPDRKGDSPGIKLAAVIPMKSLAESKSRLAPLLDPRQRASLSLNLLDLVLNAALTSSLDRVIVLGGDGDVRSLASGRGAEWMSDGGGGLNNELSAVLGQLSAAGMASVYIPGDLPLLTRSDIETVIETSLGGELLTLCPATEDGGTNGLVVPPSSPFRPTLGQDSFTRHLRAAEGLPHAVCNTPGFGLDLDSVADLEACERIQPGFTERMLSGPLRERN